MDQFLSRAARTWGVIGLGLIVKVTLVMTSGCMAPKTDSVNQTLLKNMRLARRQQTDSQIMPVTEAGRTANPAYASLWVGTRNHHYIFRDTKAQGIGDLVTIIVNEKSSASSSANTDASRTSSFDGSIQPLKFSSSGEKSWGSMLSTSTSNTFEGEGTTDRAGSLAAQITAVIEEVLPNGNFFVKGSKVVTVNNEDEIVTITGFVRPDDIRLDNTVLSSQVADARITYGGRGVVSDKQRPGWLARVLDWVWPF